MIKNRILFNIQFFSYILLSGYGFPSPLEMGNDGVGNPFIIYDNPSLINKQNGAPIGSSIYYNPSSKEYILTNGFIESFKNSGFSLSYLKNSLEEINKLSTAFSTSYKKISFGSAFHFLFSYSEPQFTLDAGLSYHFEERRYVGIVFNNIFEVDTSNDLCSREIRISTGGKLPWLKEMYYTVQGIGAIYDLKHDEYGYGGNINIQKFFLENPSLSIYSRGKVLYERNSVFVWDIEGVAGYHHFFNNFTFGIYIGYEYPAKIEDGKISFSVYINPIYKRNIATLNCDIQLTTTKLSPDGDGINDNVIIDINGTFSNKKVKTKRWTLIITDDTKTNNIIKTFSGGNIPPSSIMWDGRNTQGKLVKNGTYYLQLIIIDTINRVVSSSHKEVIVY